MRRERGRPRLLAFGVIGLWGFSLGACAVAPPPPPDSVLIPPERVVGLLSAWETEWRAFQGLRAAIDLTVSARGRTQRSAALLLVSPSRLRFEIMTPLGLPSLVAVADPDRLTVLNLVERRAWTGRPTPEALGRWVGLPVELDTLLRLLVGGVPAPADLAAVRVPPGGTHLAFRRGGIAHRVWVTATGQPSRLELENGQPIVARFERTVDGKIHVVAVAAPGRSFEAELQYLAAETLALPAAAFELRLPPGIPVERAD